MTPTTEEQIKAIKQSFSLYKDGVTAQSLRQKGCSYKVIWGISQRHLREIAQEYQPNYDLAVALWQCDVRECKHLSTMLMPVKSVDVTMAKLWMEQTKTGELAEMLVFNLLQHLSFAPDLATEWLSSSREITQLSAYNLFGRLFMKHYQPSIDVAQKFMNSAVKALQTGSVSVKRSAMNSIIRFAELGNPYNEMAKEMTQKENFDFL